MYNNINEDFSEKMGHLDREPTNSDGKKTKIHINDMDQQEEINIQPEHNKEKRIQKNEDKLRNLRDNFKCSNIQITGCQKEKKKSKKLKIYLNK